MTKYDKEFYANRQKERRRQRLADGVCLRCGGELDSESKRYCLKHSRANTEQARRKEQRWMEQGLCRQCGKRPAVEGKVRCEECLAIRRANTKKKEGTRVWREKTRIECFAAYGGKCVCCGETEPLFLEIDHINGGGNKQRKEVPGGTAMYRWLKARGYPQGEFQLLCRNCNYGRHRNHGVCPHQTMRGTGSTGELAQQLLPVIME